MTKRKIPRVQINTMIANRVLHNQHKPDSRAPAQNDTTGHCIHCGRDNSGYLKDPCSDDCPLYWEVAGIPWPESAN